MNAVEGAGQPVTQDTFDIQLSQAWRQFRSELADELAALPVGGDVTVRVDRGEGWDEFTGVRASVLNMGGQLTISVPGNAGLASEMKLTPAAMRQLRSLGLRRPYSSCASYGVDVPITHVVTT